MASTSKEKSRTPFYVYIPIICLLVLSGLAVITTSTLSYLKFLNPKYEFLFSRELHTLIYLGFSAGASALVTVLLSTGFILSRRCLGLGIFLVSLLMAVTITSGTWGMIYGKDWNQNRASSSNLQTGMVRLGYGKDDFTDVTKAWDTIEERFLCSSQYRLFHPDPDRYGYCCDNQCRPENPCGPAVVVSKQNLTQPGVQKPDPTRCPETFMSARSFSADQAVAACDRTCEDIVPQKIRDYTITMAAQSITCASLQLLTILLMLLVLLVDGGCCNKACTSLAGCCKMVGPCLVACCKVSGDGSCCTRQLAASCVCCEKSCSWTCGCLPVGISEEGENREKREEYDEKSVECGSDVPLLHDE